MPETFAEIVIEGGCHAYFGMYGPQEGDGTPTISNEEQISLTVEAIAEFMEMDREEESTRGRTYTKEKAIHVVCDTCNITLADIIAFGDDFADIGMLKLCGVGIAMGNAIDEVKEIADFVIGRNDEDGIAEYVEKEVLKRI